MSCSLFRIDTDCIIIFLENFIQNERMLLRIGSSAHLIQTLGKVKCGLLYSPLLPPSFEHEKQLAGTRDILYGSLIPTTNFIHCCEELDISINTNSIEAFRGKTTIYLCSHEVTFFPDGNIRIEEDGIILFDLVKSFEEGINDIHDRKIVQTFCSMNFSTFYKHDGFIGIEDSLFFFSDGKTGCITFSSDYLIHAARAGIDAGSLDFLYYIPGSNRAFWNTFFQDLSGREKSGLYFITTGPIPLAPLFREKNISYSATEGNTIRRTVGNITFIFQNNRLNLFYKDIKLKCPLTHPFSRGLEFTGEYSVLQKKSAFSLFYEWKGKKETDCLTSLTPLLLSQTDIFPEKTEKTELTGRGTGWYSRLIPAKKNDLKENKYTYPLFQLENTPNPFGIFISRTKLEKTEEMKERFAALWQDKKEIKPDSQLFQLYSQRFNSLLETMLFFKEERKKFQRIILYTQSIPLENFPPVDSGQTRVHMKLWDKAITTSPEAADPQPALMEKAGKTEKKGAQKRGEQTRQTRKKGNKKGEKVNKQKKKKRGKNLLAPVLLLSAVLLILFAGFIVSLRYILPGVLIKEKPKISAFLEKNAFTPDPLTAESLLTNEYGFYMTLADFRKITGAICKQNNFQAVKVKKSKLKIIPWWFYPGNVIIMPDGERKVLKRNQTLFKLCEHFFITRTNREEELTLSILNEVKRGSLSSDTAKEKLEEIKKSSYSRLLARFISRILAVEDLSVLQ